MRTEFLDLGRQPIANRFLREDEFDNEFFYDLYVEFDDETKLVSLGEFISSDMLFNENYSYYTGSSAPMISHFRMVADDIMKRNPISILEIGSNDGTFIKNFNRHMVIAVEPCMNFCQTTRDMGYTTYPYFWNRELADTILNERGNMDIVYAANCICHIPDLNETFAAVKRVLSRGGQFIFEDPSLAMMLNRNSYDQIYDEHAHIFSITALDNILRQEGLKIVDVIKLTVHGGSNRVIVEHDDGVSSPKLNYMLNEERDAGIHELKTYQDFAQRVEKSKEELQYTIDHANGKVISIGATSKSTTVFNYCRFDSDHIEYITDTTPAKQGLFSPGYHIPVVPRDSIDIKEIDYAFLGAWNFRQEIEYIERAVNGFKGQFITHVPFVERF